MHNFIYRLHLKTPAFVTRKQVMIKGLLCDCSCSLSSLSRRQATEMDQLTTETENHQRIRKVEQAFGPSGMPLSTPGRVLMGEGRLMKRGRKKWAQKAFFLFNDILVYGSVVMNGRWYKKQKVIALGDINMEDVEDGEKTKNQWLFCTPRKSFLVSASSFKEKQAWLEHIESCRCSLMEGTDLQPGTTFAISWVPDQAAEKCMRCLCKFTATNRRHHCRKCGFVVCNTCSKERGLLEHIHPTKQVRICRICIKTKDGDDSSRHRGDSSGMHSSEEEDGPVCSHEEQTQAPSMWLDTRDGTWGRLSRGF